MRALTLARKEIGTYFNSPVAYVVLSVFLLLVGYLYFSTVFLIGEASMRNFFSIAPMLLVVFGPALTMRFFAEERRSGTIELLFTLPIKKSEIIAGKFIAGLTIISIGFLLTFFYPISISMLTMPGAQFDWGPIFGGYLGLILLSSTFIAIGLFASAITKNQIVAFIVGLIICFALFFVGNFSMLFPPSIGAIFQYASVEYHFSNIARGVVDSRDIIYYLTLIGIFLFSTQRVLERVRS